MSYLYTWVVWNVFFSFIFNMHEKNTNFFTTICFNLWRCSLLKKNPNMNCYLLLMLRHNSILTSTIRARFQLFFVEFFFLLLLTRCPELSFFAATIDNCGVYVYKMYMVYSLTFFKLLIFFCWLYIVLLILDSHCIYNRHVYIHYILVSSI